MELRSLKYLLSLFERGSFTAAAKSLFITQPAVSIQLHKLQDELGITLFEMDGRSVRFTEAGEIVIDYAKRFTDLEQELRRTIDDLESLERGSIAIGTIDAASIYVLPKVFLQFQKLYPGIDVHLEIASTMPMLEGLDERRLDLVVGTMPDETPAGLVSCPIFRDRLAFIAPAGHPAAQRKSVDAASLAGYSFISFHEESITRRNVEKAFSDRGLALRISMAMDSPEAIKKLVASGLGLAVLPLRMVQDDVASGTIAVLNVRGIRIERKLALFLPIGRYTPLPVRAFLDVMESGLKIRLPEKIKSTVSQDR
jgi:DNA-binding transcriptional LysR family regulator